jgi:hypothetical protein
VIALLADGPQMSQRWPAKYASILADDPGCSVLTLTSLGMVAQSRFPAQPVSRAVALWKTGGPPSADKQLKEISLGHGYDALVLSLRRENTQEWTADGRSSQERKTFLRYVDARPIR